jgi:hypothetical protein
MVRYRPVGLLRHLQYWPARSQKLTFTILKMQLKNTNSIGHLCRHYLKEQDWSQTDISKFAIAGITKIQDETDFLQIMPSFAQAFWIMADLEDFKKFIERSTTFSGDYPSELELHVEIQKWNQLTNSQNFKKLFG